METQAAEQDPAIRFFGFLSRHRKLIIGLPLLGLLVGLALAFLLPAWYTGSVKIMPPQQTQSNAVAILGQLGGLPAGGAAALGIRNPSDIYVGMLRSRSVADSLIKRFNLVDAYGENNVTDARRELRTNSNIAAGRDGIITIEVDDRDPKRAAEIANAFVEELQAVTVRLAVSEASRRRLFFEGQLKNARNELVNAEAQLRKFTEEARLVNPPGQIGLSVAAAASLRAQIAAKEIQLSAMKSFATEENPDYQRTVKELGGLRSELAKLERNGAAEKGDVMVPFGKAPEVGMEYIRKFRDVKYYETLFEVLSKQYEIARIDEAKDATLIQVLDVAIPPEKRSKPRRLVITASAAILALLIALIVATLLDRYAGVRGRQGAREHADR